MSRDLSLHELSIRLVYLYRRYGSEYDLELQVLTYLFCCADRALQAHLYLILKEVKVYMEIDCF